MNVVIDLVGLVAVGGCVWLVVDDWRDRTGRKKCPFCRSEGMIGGPCPECGKEWPWSRHA